MTSDYSQWGEQEIVRVLLAALPDPNHWCVDVGAGDGFKLSNTRALIEDGYSAVLIDGDTAKYTALQTTASYRVLTIGTIVSPDGKNTLDAILANTIVPNDPDLLSIDIDGNDYHVWASLTNYTPKVVVIEFNPTMGEDLNFIQPRDADVGFGSSLKALVELGKRKGYKLHAVTETNAIFVRNDLAAHTGSNVDSISALWTKKSFMTWLIYDYAGNGHVIGRASSPWSDEASA